MREKTIKCKNDAYLIRYILLVEQRVSLLKDAGCSIVDSLV